MADPIERSLLARTSFKPGQIGWVTPEGVIKVHVSMHGNEGLPPGAYSVRALESITAGKRGRFARMEPET